MAIQRERKKKVLQKLNSNKQNDIITKTKHWN
jgi:hypothetical protein